LVANWISVVRGNKAYSPVLIVAIALLPVALATRAGAECVGTVLDCPGEYPEDGIALLFQSFVFSGTVGGVLALAWHLARRAATRTARGRAQSAAPRTRRSGLATAGPRPGRPTTTVRGAPRSASTRVIAGPVWIDGHWMRMVASDRDGRRIEVLESDGWEACDDAGGRLLAEALSIGTRRPPGPGTDASPSPRGKR
jgi:hypothetical protein